MAEYVLTGSRYAYRDDDNVLVIKRRGDKVELTKEQEQRFKAGQPGSPFQHESEVQEVETDEVAVANEATKPSEDGFQASAAGTTNRKVAAVRPVARKAAEDPKEGSDDLPEPTTSTANKSGARK